MGNNKLQRRHGCLRQRDVFEHVFTGRENKMTGKQRDSDAHDIAMMKKK